MRWKIPLFLVGWSVFAGCGAPPVVAPPSAESPDAGGVPPVRLPTVEWGRCDTTDWPVGYPQPSDLITQCAMVPAPLDWSAPEGEKILLRVARQKSNAFPTGKAVFQLAGGPGGAAVFQSGLIPNLFGSLRATFDLVYVDQRGTGGSGHLVCFSGYPETQREWEACAGDQEGVPLRFYSTLDAARDLDFVRAVLGYQNIAIRGGSYGTRLGLEYMRQFPQHLTAAVLDGLAPPDFDLAGSVITQTDLGVQWLVADCAADPACAQVAPDLAADLLAWRAAVQANPRPLNVEGRAYAEDVTLFRDALGAALGYAPLRFLVPRAIHEAVLGDTHAWNNVLTQLFGVTVRDAASGGAPLPPSPRGRRGLSLRRPDTRGVVDYVAPGLYAAVACSEWIPNTTLAAAEALVAQQQWDDGHFLGFVNACRVWPVTPLEPALRAPVASSVKTLLLSGAIDILTPPMAAEHARETLPNATHLVVPHTTHSTMGVPCVSSIITAFLHNDGEMAGVDTRCLATVGHPVW